MLPVLCSVLCFLVISSNGAKDRLPWWKTAVLYQVYPRSFQDSNGDGVGDFPGILQRADYFKEIGVTAIWISPFLKSPLADFGYDVSDYRMLDPQFGDIQDFKNLVKKMRSLEIKLLMDLVPNHTSDEHEWFQKSVKREGKYTDYYVWVDGTKGTPPNNWINNFTGPAWSWNEKRGQFYLHQFTPRQPDLNYRNNDVVKEMDDIITFWLDNGVDGFRVDAVPFLFEDPDLRDNPVKDGVYSDIHTQNLLESYNLTCHWSELVQNYSLNDKKERGIFTEAYANDSATVNYYCSDPFSITQPFFFGLLKKGNKFTTADSFRTIIRNWINIIPANKSTNWVIGNHDNKRAANRFDPLMVDSMNLLTGILPGSKVTYYGEEIGMEDTPVTYEQSQDSAALVLGPDRYLEQSRDPARTPMQWDDSEPAAGFSTNYTTWLPLNDNFKLVNVDSQRQAKNSHLKVFQAMTSIRRDPIIRQGSLTVSVYKETLIVIRSIKASFILLCINLDNSYALYTTKDFFAPRGMDTNMRVVTTSVDNYFKAGDKVAKGYAYVLNKPKGAILLKSV